MVALYATIGQPVGRAEGPEKVTGAAIYPADINSPGTLVGRCLRSPYPYARIRSIDASAARRVPGVHAVLTGFDIPERLVGRMLRDMPVLARDVLRFVGQKVAADVGAADAALSGPQRGGQSRGHLRCAAPELPSHHRSMEQAPRRRSTLFKGFRPSFSARAV